MLILSNAVASITLLGVTQFVSNGESFYIEYEGPGGDAKRLTLTAAAWKVEVDLDMDLTRWLEL